MSDVCHLRLFVSGRSPQTHRALQALRRIEQRIAASGIEVRVEVVDVLVNPDAAEAERVMATPTLVREEPTPSRRVIGDLNDVRVALTALELDGLDWPSPFLELRSA